MGAHWKGYVVAHEIEDVVSHWIGYVVAHEIADVVAHE